MSKKKYRRVRTTPMPRRMAALLVVALMCVASVGAQNTDLLTCIQKGDVAGVKKHLSQGADVNALLPEDKIGFRSVTPLYEAVSVGNMELITLLLDRKADPNKEISEAESTGPGDTPLCRAARDGNFQIAKLLIARGAKITAECLLAAKAGEMKEYLTKNISAEDLLKYYQNRILAAVNKADVNALAAVGAEMGVIKMGDCPEALLIWYANAPLQLREIVKKYGPADVASAKVNALDFLLRGGINTVGNTKFETLPLPLATSFLPDQKDPLRYAAAKAVDADPATSWVEGVDGPGVGQKIAMAVPDGAVAISVVPGYGDAQFWPQNNRVKSARLTLYALADYEEAGTWVWGHTYKVKPLGETVLNFTDRLLTQQFPLPSFKSNLESVESLLAIMEILEVFPGAKWNDTCIAEIRFINAAGQPLPRK